MRHWNYDDYLRDAAQRLSAGDAAPPMSAAGLDELANVVRTAREELQIPAGIEADARLTARVNYHEAVQHVPYGSTTAAFDVSEAEVLSDRVEVPYDNGDLLPTQFVGNVPCPRHRHDDRSVPCLFELVEIRQGVAVYSVALTDD